MAAPQSKRETQERQFRLVKFFAYASFIVLFLFSFPFSVVISQQAKDSLIESYESYALLLGENLNHQVFQNFVIPVTRSFGKIRLRERKQYEWMDKIVKNTIHGLNIELVNIYDLDRGIVVYSTDPALPGKVTNRGPGYEKALKGEYSVGFISEGDSFWGPGIRGSRQLRTYVPFRGMDPFTGDKGHVLAVFEIIQDMTPQYRNIVKLQYLIFGLSILIMGLIFVALLLIVRKAETILEERAARQRELQSKLDQAERLAALGKMCAGVSHEIRNPLGIIKSTAELLGSMSDSEQGQKRLSAVIVEESDRLDNIVTEFLDFARPKEPNYQECYLEELITKNLHFLEPELNKENISVRHNLNGRSFKLHGDPHLLYRSFLNIFVNAIQSMESGGSINVDVSEVKDGYVIGVSDTGAGIAEEDLSKIFDPFFTTKDKGSGLGLSIVRNIIEGHRGAIHIDSREGKGTTVSITLPKG
ncbi:MAG: two-component sensor histidine kinase [Deltaproteobacteria bacterium]|nr:two-component sensor histidine kinase [Deltaproteobacteria bacterium]